MTSTVVFYLVSIALVLISCTATLGTIIRIESSDDAVIRYRLRELGVRQVKNGERENYKRLEPQLFSVNDWQLDQLKQHGIEFTTESTESRDSEEHSRWKEAVVAERRKRQSANRTNPFQKVIAPMYHDYLELSTLMENVRTSCHKIARVSSIGQSAQGRDNPDLDEPGEPEVKLTGNIHGNEIIVRSTSWRSYACPAANSDNFAVASQGREILISLIKYICLNYETRSSVRSLIDDIDLWIIPSLNPDGCESGSSSNANGVDLNREFPDQFSVKGFNADKPEYDETIRRNRQPEVLAFMDWSMRHNFVLSATLHGGSVVVAYPFDGNHRRLPGLPSPTPDEMIFRHIASVWADNNPDMKNSVTFTDGITNGADWYPIYGSQADFEYLWSGTMAITVELSNRKWPPFTQYHKYWDNNFHSVFNFLDLSRTMGIRGVVLDAETSEPLSARIYVKSPFFGHWVNTDRQTGDYFRLLPGGYEYTIEAAAVGYQRTRKQIKLPNPQVTQETLNFLLYREQ